MPTQTTQRAKQGYKGTATPRRKKIQENAERMLREVGGNQEKSTLQSRRRDTKCCEQLETEWGRGESHHKVLTAGGIEEGNGGR